MKKDNYIYYLCDLNKRITFSKELGINMCKINGTTELNGIMKTLQPLYADRIPLVCYYKIKNRNCFEVNKMIKQNFIDIRSDTLGGVNSDFYSAEKLTPNELEQFFKENNIGYEYLKPTEEQFKIFRKRLSDEENKKILDELEYEYE